MTYILKVAFVGLLIQLLQNQQQDQFASSLFALFVNAQLSDHLKVKNTSKLIKGISNTLQNCNDTAISMSFVGSLFPKF